MDGNTPLMLAVKGKLEDNVRALVNAKASVGVANNKGETPLTIACGTHLLDTLLKSSSATFALAVYDSKGFTPLIRSIQKLDNTLTRKLLDAKANPNHVSADGSMPLEALILAHVPTAPANVKYNILKALLRAGASVHGRGKYGTSNLTKAITSSSSAYPYQPPLMGFVK
jgi:ankyrin repeat protein